MSDSVLKIFEGEVGETINSLGQEINRCAHEHGWYENGKRNFGEVVALMHTELSEAYEEYRNGHTMQEIYYTAAGKPEGIAVELADCVIRILDTCFEEGIPITQAIFEKMQYNESRPYRHGGKLS